MNEDDLMICCVCDGKFLELKFKCFECKLPICKSCLQEHELEGCPYPVPHCWKCCDKVVLEIG